MKKFMMMALVLAGVSVGLVMCGGSGGGGGGLGMSMSGGGATSTWDLFFMLATPACPQSFISSGAGLLNLFPGGAFPGTSVLSSGYEYNADIPETHILGYTIISAGKILPGDQVRVRFRYQLNADGQDGDFFLVRIIDGNRFLTPTALSGFWMTRDAPEERDFTYRATDNGFALQFIVGLSEAEDAVYLDAVQVWVNGALLFEDLFEGGDYTQPSCINADLSALRTPFVPNNPDGTFGLSNAVVLEGALSLEITGGQYFQLYGMGGRMGGMAGAMLTYTSSNLLNPFYGQSYAAEQNGILVGDYQGWNKPTYVPDDPAYCAETGQLLLAQNLGGNADLSGQWQLTINAMCEEAPLVLNETINGLGVFRLFSTFGILPFSLNNGEDLVAVAGGFSLGPMVMLNLGSFPPAWQAQLLGVYSSSAPEGFPLPLPPGVPIVTGQIRGTLPGPGNGICTVSSGTFIAVIDGSVFVEPPRVGNCVLPP